MDNQIIITMDEFNNNVISSTFSVSPTFSRIKKIYRNNILIGKFYLPYTDTGLTSGESYDYRVENAYDCNQF